MTPGRSGKSRAVRGQRPRGYAPRKKARETVPTGSAPVAARACLPKDARRAHRMPLAARSKPCAHLYRYRGYRAPYGHCRPSAPAFRSRRSPFSRLPGRAPLGRACSWSAALGRGRAPARSWPRPRSSLRRSCSGPLLPGRRVGVPPSPPPSALPRALRRYPPDTERGPWPRSHGPPWASAQPLLGTRPTAAGLPGKAAVLAVELERVRLRGCLAVAVLERLDKHLARALVAPGQHEGQVGVVLDLAAAPE